MYEPIQRLSDEELAAFCKANCNNSRFGEDDFEHYQVKRGLRNGDGTGVVAGLTRICNVHGYVLDEGERAPIEGQLFYRGISIDDLVAGFVREKRFGFEETVYLLLCGQLPNPGQLTAFREAMAGQMKLTHEFMQDLILMAPSQSIMNTLQRATLALYSFDPDPENQSRENVMAQSLSLIAKMPLITTAIYEAKQFAMGRQNMHFYAPDASRSLAENILLTLRQNQQYSADEAELLDLLMVIHAEHGGGNNSTFAARVLTSAATDTYSAIAAAIGSLKGFRHGGASHKVVEMLDSIRQGVADWTDEEELLRFLESLLRREAGDRSGLLYGLGHAVYTQSDPRATLLKGFLQRVTTDSPWAKEMQLIRNVERLAPRAFERVRGVSRPLCANVDLYSGLAYSVLGIPRDMFTPMFCVARMAGWCAHRLEELTTPGGKVIRPAYKSICPQQAYVPLVDR